MKYPSALAAALAVVSISTLSAATVVWTPGANGNIGIGANYNAPGNPPADGDTLTSDGVGSIIGFDNTNTGLSLAQMDLNFTSGATIFNQTAGTFTVGTLRFGGAGGSRNPTYNLSGGTLNISTAFNWSNGNSARFNVSNGTVNYGGSGFLSIGTAGGANGAIDMTGGTFNGNSITNLRLGSSSGGTGSLVLSNNAVLNMTATVNAYLGNNSGTGNITMSGTSQLDFGTGAISVGQAGTSVGTITMNGGTLTAGRFVLGGDNAASGATGVINLNGGTIAATAIQLGASNAVGSPSVTQNVLHANGGTVKVLFDATRNADFFGRNDGVSANGIYVDLQGGGLNFDTNGNATTIAADITVAGIGNFVKQGAGALTILGSKTFTGDTVIEGGSIVLGNSDVFDNASDLVLDGGTLALADFSEAFATLNLESTSTLDFGTLLGGANTLTFADSSAVAWSGSLILTNFDVTGDFLNFSSATGLTGGQLDAISLAGYNATGLDGLGNVVFTAVPEPSEVSLAIAAGLGLLAFARRRRRTAHA